MVYAYGLRADMITNNPTCQFKSLLVKGTMIMNITFEMSRRTNYGENLRHRPGSKGRGDLSG